MGRGACLVAEIARDDILKRIAISLHYTECAIVLGADGRHSDPVSRTYVESIIPKPGGGKCSLDGQFSLTGVAVFVAFRHVRIQEISEYERGIEMT